MATHFFDGQRLVQDTLMFWVDQTTEHPSHPGETRWAIYDTDGGVEFFESKQAAKDRLAQYAAEQEDADAFDTEVRAAALDALETLSDMTTEQFSRGDDRAVRRRLAKALGLDPQDYSL